MQRLDETKRVAILDAAATLFSKRTFQDVRLDDVAAAAQVGKGTLYIYFKDKDELYLSLIREGFSALVDQLTVDLANEDGDPWKQLRTVIRRLVSFHTDRPQMFQVMRNGALGKPDPRIRAKRAELARLIERVLRRGVATHQLSDPRPDLTAQLVPGLVRSAMLFGPEGLTEPELSNHIIRLLRQGIRRRTAQ